MLVQLVPIVAIISSSRGIIYSTPLLLGGKTRYTVSQSRYRGNTRATLMRCARKEPAEAQSPIRNTDACNYAYQPAGDFVVIRRPATLPTPIYALPAALATTKLVVGRYMSCAGILYNTIGPREIALTAIIDARRLGTLEFGRLPL